jgi:phosphatidylinositol alpha-1,6-mannosyltransferase
MSKKVVLLTLQMFSSTGGIQKMCRTLAYSLNHIAAEQQWHFKTLSAYDADDDLMPQYLEANSFKGFKIKRIQFVWNVLREANHTNVVILTHINLSIVGLLVKMIKPDCKVCLIAHGKEIWCKLSAIQKKMLDKCDKIICVSNFTRQQIITMHHTDSSRCFVLNNAIDPFIPLPDNFEKPAALMEKYNLRAGEPVLYALTRIAAAEQYKGYEQVIKAMVPLKEVFPKLKYILSGPYDKDEEYRINRLIDDCGLAGSVILTGFLEEKHLVDHFLLADIFVLPSKKEGFGIVFIEAMACGLPVICGNVDGSLDAIRNGELGLAIDPEDQQALETAILMELKKGPPSANRRSQLQSSCIQYFNEHHYRDNLKQLLLT